MAYGSQIKDLRGGFSHAHAWDKHVADAINDSEFWKLLWTSATQVAPRFGKKNVEVLTKGFNP
jgi:hypothetical protein